MLPEDNGERVLCSTPNLRRECEEDLCCKSLRKHSPGSRLINPAGAQVKERLLVKATDGRAVTTLDVVVVDLELWAGQRTRL